MTEPRIEPAHTALVVIDLQTGIVAQPVVPRPAHQVITNATQLLEQARKTGVLPVLVHVGGAADWSDRLHQSGDRPSPVRALPADWSDFVPELQPAPGEVSILKRQWGAFYGTDLDLQLRRRGIDTIILCGIATEIGVESTARFAYEHNYRQIFVEDAMSGFSVSAHQNSIEHIFPRIGHVRPTDWVIQQLGG